MTRFWMGSAAAFMAVSLAGLNAQSTGSQTPQTQTPQTPASQQATAPTTLKGCVYKEEAIAGRTPNVAERAGVMEDYILVVSNTSASTSPSTGTATGTGTTGSATTPQTATGTSGAGMHKAFKLEKIADERLRAMVGKMVEVTGRSDADNDTAKNRGTGVAGTTPDRGLGPDQIELPEFEVTDIKEVEGTCPATPQINKK